MSMEDRTPPTQRSSNARSGLADIVLVVYVCENFEECGGYYGTSDMPLLEEEWNVKPVTDKNPGQRTHTRAHCHICGGNRIRRYARIVPQDEVAEAEQKIRAQRGTLVGDIAGMPRQ